MKPQPERITKGLWWDRPLKLVEGCIHVSPGCDHCWSAREANMRANNPNAKIKEQYAGLTEGVRWNGQIRLMEKNLDLPLRVRKPQVWAVWNDLFHEDVPFEFIGKVFARMYNTRYHTFIVLTKRPKRMAEFIHWYKTEWLAGFESAWPREYQHLWLGVTAENQAMADERIPILLQIPAAVRFVSVEPMLSDVMLSPWLGRVSGCRIHCPTTCHSCRLHSWECKEAHDNRDGINLVICGAESGPNRRKTEIDSIRNLRDQCVASGTKFFLKQMEVGGKLVKMPELDGQTWAQWPEVQP